MNFTLEKSIEILSRTPNVLNAMLSDIPSDWYSKNEGGDTWSPYDIVGHLVHGERADWIPRLKIILSGTPERKFESFDRFAQFEESKGKSLTTLLDEFSELRAQNVSFLKSEKRIPENMDTTGVHPAFGDVTLRQLLSTWVVHDLNHIAQISRVMANQYKAEVGPWVAYLRILQQ